MVKKIVLCLIACIIIVSIIISVFLLRCNELINAQSIRIYWMYSKDCEIESYSISTRIGALKIWILLNTSSWELTSDKEYIHLTYPFIGLSVSNDKEIWITYSNGYVI